MEKIKILVLAPQGERRKDIVEVMEKYDHIQLNTIDNISKEIFDRIKEISPQIIIIDSNIGKDHYHLAERISRRFSKVGLIVIEGEVIEDDLYRGFFAGAEDVIALSDIDKGLIESITRVYELIKKKEDESIYNFIPTRKVRGNGKVITIFSAKGGVGKTFITTNLAIILAQKGEKKVAIVDLNFGDVALSLNINPKYTMEDIIDNINLAGEIEINPYMIDYESGIKILSTQLSEGMNQSIDPNKINIILQYLRSIFDYIIIDTPNNFYMPISPALQIADLILMITTSEMPALQSTSLALMKLWNLNYSSGKVKVILNKRRRIGQISLEDINKVLGKSIYQTIRDQHRKVNRALNYGRPVVLLYPEGQMARQLTKLGEDLIRELGNVLKSTKYE